MAVIFYDEGDHPSGFIGYRVATTCGNEKDYRQKYFSLRKMSKQQAEASAHRLNELWRKEAQEERVDRCVFTNRRENWGANIITEGFRCGLRVEKRAVGSCLTPIFIVTNSGFGISDFEFSIKRLGYCGAWDAAIKCYEQRYDPPAWKLEEIRKAMPDDWVFAEFLAGRAISKGKAITDDNISELYEILGTDYAC